MPLFQKYKVPKVVVAVIILGICTLSAYSQEWVRKIYGPDEDLEGKSLYEIKERADEHFRFARQEYFSRYFRLDDNPELKYSNVSDYIAYKRWEEYWMNHVDSEGKQVSPMFEYNEFTSFLKGRSSKGPVANWVNINRTAAPGGYWGMGRIREIAFHPTDPNTIWLGADQGGVWKSTDNGKTYTPVGDGLPFLRVSSLCVDFNNPDIIYMAGGGIGTNYWQRAIGVYKTTDGGNTWQPTGFSSNLWDNKYIRRLAMSPVNSSLLFVTTNDGTYRTSDGGDTWERVNSNESWDILFHPDGSRVMIGKGQSIFLSDDLGESWEMAVNSGELGTFKHFSVSPVNTDYMAAQVEGNGFTSIYFSTDGGSTWEKKSTVEDTGGTIGFSSNDPETLYRGWTKIFRSEDRGQTWVQITNWYNTPSHPEIHADFFRIEKNPHKPDTLYFTNDGGMYIYNEPLNQWTEYSEGLIISQYYSLSSSQTDENVLLCGSQDNGGWYRQSSGAWRTTNGGDGMHTWQSPVDNDYGYSSYPGGKIYRTHAGWSFYAALFDNIYPVPDEGDWNSRFAIDPNNHNRIVTGCFKDVYESKDKGESWKKISNNLTGGRNLHAITIPEGNSSIIYTSAGANFYYTQDGGGEWKSSYIPGGNTINEIVASDYDPKLVWVVTGGYTEGHKVFRSNDYGKNWTNISGSLPNIPALSIIHQKGTLGTLYVGMTYGIYYRHPDMNDWEFYGDGIPNTEIRDLDIYYPTSKIRSATYGRGLYEADLVPLDGTMPEVSFSTNESTVCLGENVEFSNLTTGADTYIWNFGDGRNSPLNSPVHLYEQAGTYSVTLTAFSENFAASYTSPEKINIRPYVDAIHVGAKNREIGPGIYSGGGEGGVLFNVHFPTKLISVRVYSSSSVRRSFEVYDNNGTLIKKVTANLSQGENRVVIDCDLEPGNDYRLSTPNSENLFYNYSGAEFPYGKDELFSVTGSTDLRGSTYLYFYDWIVQYLTCSTEVLPEIDGDANLAAREITVYPNPYQDLFRLVIKGFADDENVTVRIIRMDGTVLFLKEMGLERELNLDINSLSDQAGNLLVEASGSSRKVSSQILRIRR